jgi:hypothetical protein
MLRSENPLMRILVALALLLAGVLQAHARCGLSDLGESTVSALRDDSTVVLGDGRAVKLSASKPRRTRPRALRELALERGVRRLSTGPAGRYGPHRALRDAARVRRDAEPAPAAKPPGGRRTRRASRGSGSGPNPNFCPLAGGTWAVDADELGRFVLVEGEVVSVRESGGTIYVNFGRPCTRDFAVLQAAFRAAGRDPFGFTGRQLRVRGFLERRTGTVIEAMAPEQMELLD